MSKILDRLRKLMRLGNATASEGECRAALAVARRLMIANNIEERDLRDGDTTAHYTNQTILDGPRRPPQAAFILTILQEFYGVQPMCAHRIGKRGFTITIFGDASAVKIAAYVFGYLRRTYTGLWTDYRKQTNCPRSKEARFYLGVEQGLSESLQRSARDDSEAEQTAIVAVKKDLAEAMGNHFGEDTAPIRLKTTVDPDKNVGAAGEAAGRGIRIPAAAPEVLLVGGLAD